MKSIGEGFGDMEDVGRFVDAIFPDGFRGEVGAVGFDQEAVQADEFCSPADQFQMGLKEPLLVGPVGDLFFHDRGKP